MFQWSNKINKSIAFDPQEPADQSLLAAIEAELVKQPHKSFSEICKAALQQAFLPEFAQSGSRETGLEQKFVDLQRQFVELEQRLATKESSRLDFLERQVQQLTLQLAQLALSPHQPFPAEAVAQSLPEPVVEDPLPEEEVDPILSHLSTFADDF